jgi:hypothetical protein
MPRDFFSFFFFFDSLYFTVHHNFCHYSLPKFAVEDASLNYNLIYKSSTPFVKFVAAVV